MVVALAIGAKACLVGRAFLFGLMVGGERGVDRAITILSEEIAPRSSCWGRQHRELNRSHVALR